jgi:hypothetical protein
MFLCQQLSDNVEAKIEGPAAHLWVHKPATYSSPSASHPARQICACNIRTGGRMSAAFERECAFHAAASVKLNCNSASAATRTVFQAASGSMFVIPMAGAPRCLRRRPPAAGR